MAKIECSFYSSALKKNTKSIIILPSLSPQEFLDGDDNKYLKENTKFQTLYLLHGSYGGFDDWTLNTNISTYAEENCLAVVMPDGENSGYNNIATGDYMKYISEELPEYLETIFPLSTKRENRFIAGLSMGGYGASFIALMNRNIYSYCGVLSGCVDFYGLLEGSSSYSKMMCDNYKRQFESYIQSNCNLYFALDKSNQSSINDTKFFFTSGDNDLFIDEIMQFADTLIDKGFDVQKQVAPGAHNWIYWNEHIKDVIKWLPLYNNCVLS